MNQGNEQPTCDDVLAHLVDLASGNGPTWASAHAASCGTCRLRIEAQHLIARELRSLPQVAVPRDLMRSIEDALKKVDTKENERSPFRFSQPVVWRFATALVAAACLVVGIWSYFWMTPSVELTLSELVNVDIAVDSSIALSDVEMSVSLPDALEVVSEDPNLVDLKHMRWTTQFAPGTNRFSVVVRARRQGSHRMTVLVRADGETESMDLKVEVKGRANEQAMQRTRPRAEGPS